MTLPLTLYFSWNSQALAHLKTLGGLGRGEVYLFKNFLFPKRLAVSGRGGKGPGFGRPDSSLP